MKFNTKKKSSAIENHMGGVAYKHPAKEELALATLSSFIEDSYYESKDARVNRIAELVADIAKKDPLFIGKLAVVTRREFHMRSAFHVLVGELARAHNGDSLVANTILEGVERPDDLLEIASFKDARKSNQIKKGIRNAFAKFNGHQLAKYRGENKDISLVDLVNLVHPTPTLKNSKALTQLVNDELRNTETWEARLSAGEDKAEVWQDLIKSGKIGYMALLRNLRNIAKDGDEETVRLAAEMIADRDAVLKSKQLPFRFLSAFEALDEFGLGTRKISTTRRLKFEKDVDRAMVLRQALESALKHSVDNLPRLYGKTMILSDNSGSMTGDWGGSSKVSELSKRKTSDIGNLFSVLYWLRADNTYVGVFGDNLRSPDFDRDAGVFENFEKITKVGAGIGGGTEAGIFEAMRTLIDTKEKVDRIVIFSDSQIGTGCSWYGHGSDRGNFNALFAQYKKINPDVKVYSIDIKGYGNKIAPDGIFLLGGWSDKVFSLMEVVEKEQGLVKWIEDYPVEL